MSTPDGLPPLREVIQKHGLTAQKSLGQNFLLDLNLTSKIARSAGVLENTTVYEVGPGPGGLTRALLLNGAKKVVAIERDNRCINALEEVAELYPGRLEIIEGDALEFDWQNQCNSPCKIVSNLPYNIGTPLLTGWLTQKVWPPSFESMTLMFQKEVAERICALSGSKEFGRLSVLCGWRTNARILFDVSAKAFTPPPKVTSAIVHLEPIPKPLQCKLEKLEAVTRLAFGQRRKMLRASLKGIGGEGLLHRANVPPTLRAEQLAIEDFVRIANAF